MSRHLLHVGYPKAGSTFLQRWFEAHPQLAFQDDGIAGFRTVHDIVREAAAESSESAPRYRVTSCEALTAPFPKLGSLGYDYHTERRADLETGQRRACSMLSALFPAALVLIVTRGYRSMILSSYSQYVRSGGTSTFEELVSPDSTRADHPWHYDRVIATYRDAFRANDVIVMPYELLRDDPARFTGWLSARLGIAPVVPDSRRVNESLSSEELYWYPRMAKLTGRAGSRLRKLYVPLAFRNRLRLPIQLLGRLKTGGVSAELIDDAMLERFRGCADSLRENPLYEPYAADYLF